MISYQDWEGYKPKKFPDKGRKRFQIFAPEIITPKGSSTSKSIYTDPSQSQLPQISKTVLENKANKESNKLQHFYEEPRQKKQFQPQIIDFKDERLHLRQDKNNHVEDLQQGIKTFDNANQSSNARYILEDAMQRKIRVENKRNQIGIHYLGDKSYHIPDYSPNFFKDPSGLIPGSNIQNRHFYLKLS